MKLEVLISCMRQDDLSIIRRSNVLTDVLVINQGDGEDTIEDTVGNHCFRMISTVERGLSKSRNMALRNATGDICLICDDDEILFDDYEERILKVYKEHQDADIIAFQIDDAGKGYPRHERKLNYLSSLKIASWQISFRRESVLNAKIRFDETLVSGVSKAGGEEVMFLYDCLKKGLKLYYVPVSIGRMIEGESQWFHGFDEDYFYDRGLFTRKLMGRWWASLYAIYYIVFKYQKYRKDITVWGALRNIFAGIW